jgi:hypothetical protein
VNQVLLTEAEDKEREEAVKQNVRRRGETRACFPGVFGILCARLFRPMNLLPRLLLPAFVLPLLASATAALAAPYDELIAKDKPAAYWNSSPAATQALLQGGAQLGEGPRPPEYPAFGEGNHAILLGQPGASLRIPDPGAESLYDFKKGDSITLEAWVRCDQLGSGQNAYIIGKGRTGRPGQPAHNQNWGLRLREDDGTARVSFVFRDERDATTDSQDFWHRWTANTGFLPGAGWHHVAILYTFGKSDSIRGFVDGTMVGGAWDMGGATELGPWVDDDEVWLGSSMRGAAGPSLRGGIDEVAIYRKLVSAETLKARFQRVSPAPVVKLGDLPKGVVRVEVLEHRTKEDEALAGDWTVNDSDSGKSNAGFEASWGNVPATVTESWTEPAFGLAQLIAKYSPRGVQRDRSIPFLVRMSAAVTLPPGEHRVLVRAMRGGRLSVDGEIVATSSFFPKPAGVTRASDAEAVADQLEVQSVKEMTVLPPGHSEAMATVKGDGQPHVFTFESFVGGKNLRPELGQPLVAISTRGAPFRLLAASDQWFDVGDEAWKQYAKEQQARVMQLASERRANAEELAYWKMRHELARAEIAKKPAVVVPEVRSPKAVIRNPIDAFIEAKFAGTAVQPSDLVDGATFLRRVTLDTIGLVPTPEELSAFSAEDPASDKRSQAIDRLLNDPRWADLWLPYWQDVLAENPAILKATLNNTGPFRFFLRDALRDNWAMDRFVTALVSMEGSSRNGGAAGFGIASQNDLPMANKAQILSSAFLAMEMKCARCHDAPNHPFNQADLFAISAMLQRAPVKVPGTSLTQGLSANSHVVVSLKAGDKIDGHFPFADLPSEPLPGVLRNTEDTREQLAAILTDPRNERFAQVVVNRLWKRLLGFGIIDPVDDWEDVSPSHKDLLTWLGRELITHDYDLKHVARLIMNSAAYQRVVTDGGSRFAKPEKRFFESPARRRLSAEQLVDSLFQVAGKEFDSEELNFDLDGRRTIKDFLNLGKPQRSWEFVGLSNERDRPSLGKPAAQPFTDVLSNFGWRDSRAEPKTLREEAPNVIQPALLANGILGARITRLSDDSAFTALALRDQPLDKLVTQLFERVLTRGPSAKERAAFTAMLAEGYGERLLAVPSGDLPKKPRITKFAMWSNHLHPDSTPIVYDREKAVRAGDPATPRLAAPWRERMEDAVWALIITPEFTYVP